MKEHELVSSMTATSHEMEGSVDLKEILCNGTYVLVQFGGNYCPKCGEEL